MAKKKKIPMLPFNHRLVLSQWLIERCGFNRLGAHKADNNTWHPLQNIANILQNRREGMDADNLHYFYKELDLEWPEDAAVTRDDLLRYEQNIVKHTLAINKKRSHSIVWKYYQWLSLLFVEIYLARYFGDRDELKSSLNEYIARFNAYWEEKDIQIDVKPYTTQELNKICLQNATGSGKTLLMHVNFLQFCDYADKSRLKNDLARTVLITPNEGLSEQHVREMEASGIPAERLSTDSNDLFASGKSGLGQVDFTEITKLSDEDGPNQIAVRNLGDQNLLLVDEAHRGMGSKEETGWFRSRERLVEKGFAFEYSATFKEAITAANRPEIEAAYSKNILFDYSYRYFYEDGYGKDYRIFNLPKSHELFRFTYLMACLISFYQQIKLYEDKKTAFHCYNLEKPLWVFVGKSVSKATGSKDEKETVSDVVLILQFIADILKNETYSASVIEDILRKSAQDTGLLDDTGNDIFAESFLYIKDLLNKEDWSYRNLLRDIFTTVFLNSGGGQLNLAKIKGNDNEVMLRVGQTEVPFGLINVGDASGLMKHIEDKKRSDPESFSNLNLVEAQFSEALFGQVHESSSPVTLLLGSKKFIEGWDCWRVSTLGLMHVGKSEGSQIIQLFGRGVRLKGYNWTLKRSSSFANQKNPPKHIQYLETLNIFGVQADFMNRFKKFLEEEKLHQKVSDTIALKVTYDFNKELKILRPRRKRSNGEEYDFRKDAKAPSFGDIPDGPKIAIDWYPRIQSLESKSKRRDSTKNSEQFSKDHRAFLDYDDLFFQAEKFKRDRNWHNLNISKDQVREFLESATSYELLVPAHIMEKNNIINIFLWQEMARELVQKYCIALYNYSKAAFIKPRLELRNLEPEDNYIPNEYRLTVDSTEEGLIGDIRSLKDDIQQEKTGLCAHGDLKAYLFDTHLYQPVIHVAKNSKIQISPLPLNESEFQFIQDLRDYLQRNKEEELYLLRNESRGKGIGFFEAGNFYPDFILWKVKGDIQYIAFIEPHGLQHTGEKDKKIEFHKTIKSIQNGLPSKNVCLNSFIVTPTEFKDLKWEWDIDKCKKNNIYFMRGPEKKYVSDILTKMSDKNENNC